MAKFDREKEREERRERDLIIKLPKKKMKFGEYVVCGIRSEIF